MEFGIALAPVPTGDSVESKTCDGVPVVLRDGDAHRPGGPWFVGGRSLKQLLEDLAAHCAQSARGAVALHLLLGVTENVDELLDALEQTACERAQEGSYLAALLVALGVRRPKRVASLFPQLVGADVLATLGDVGRERALQVLGSESVEDRRQAVAALRYMLDEEIVPAARNRRVEAAHAIEEDPQTREALAALLKASREAFEAGCGAQVLGQHRRQAGDSPASQPGTAGLSQRALLRAARVGCSRSSSKAGGRRRG